MGAACDKDNRTPWKLSDASKALPVYDLTDGRTLYDDFDGNGNFQTYDNQNLAVAGELSAKIWTSYAGGEIVPDPAASSLFSVADERGQRVEYRLQEGPVREIRYVFDGDGKLREAVPHVQGQPYYSSKKFLWTAAADGRYRAKEGFVSVEKGRIYGVVSVIPDQASGDVLKITNSLDDEFTRCILQNPSALDFIDFKSLSFDVMLSSASSAPGFGAGFDYHTTIPEQPPGKSWLAQILLSKKASGNVRIVGQYINVNLGIQVSDILGTAQLDTWYNLRLDIVTRKDDPSLQEDELRLDYYVNGDLKVSRIPEDSQILIDPERTGWGPQRSFVVGRDQGTGDCIGFFDNVRAVYSNRIS